MNKQQQIIIGAVVAVVVLGGAAFFLLRKSPEPVADTTTTTASSPMPVTPAGTPTGMNEPGAATAANPNPAVPAPFPGGAKGGIFSNKPGTPGTPAAKVASAQPPSGPGHDPFQTWWKNPNQVTPVFDIVQPVRVASVNPYIPPPPNTEIREVPTRRVSGIMSGDGVYAILEGNGEPEIVKPGSRTSDGYRVVSITADSVKLQRKEGNVTLTQVVPLSDVPLSGVQTAGFRGGAGVGRAGFPGAPGMGPGGVPGFRPGGGGGKED